MIVDGRAIARSLKEKLSRDLAGRPPLVLEVFMWADDLATRQFVAIKRRFADEIGVSMRTHTLDGSLTTEALIERIAEAAGRSDGIIIQFPLPPQLDSERIRNAVPFSHDIDLISDAAISAFAKGDYTRTPPVAGAIKEVLDAHRVALRGKRVVVVGEGRLVGKPAALLSRLEGAEVVTVGERTEDIRALTKGADVLILGAGVPGLITPDMIKEGAVLLDAGTSEARGRVVGDAAPECASKCALFTPVPGGIGPITVAMIFKNLAAGAPRAKSGA